MKTPEQFQPGDKVTYVPNYGRPEHGIVKTVYTDRIFVVYACHEDWDNYANYTAANTPVEDLKWGWLNEDKLHELNRKSIDKAIDDLIAPFRKGKMRRYNEGSMFDQLPDLPFYCMYISHGSHTKRFHARLKENERYEFSLNDSSGKIDIFVNIELTKWSIPRYMDPLIYYKYPYIVIDKATFIKAFDIISGGRGSFIQSLVEG